MSDRIAVWFSCGAASAVAAKLTIERFPDAIVRVVNNPVLEEDDDNYRFLCEVEAWLGREIETAVNSNYPAASAVEVWSKRKFMSGPTGAPCTIELKKRARQEWEANNPVDWHVLGFTMDEMERHKRFVLSERDNVIPVLIDARLTKQDCIDVIMRAGIKPPRVYSLGYPNANCIGCVKATSPTYWNLVRQTHPVVFGSRARQSRAIGAKLVRHNGERIFLDELPPDAKGRPLAKMEMDCGIFCEERE